MNWFLLGFALTLSLSALAVEKKIVVDLSTQKLTCFERGVPVAVYHVSTGRKGYRTPTGSFVIHHKRKIGYALKKYGGGRLPWMMRVSGKINIHGYKSVPKYPASHGCIRLTPTNAKQVYDWAPVGTTIIIQK